MKKIFFLLVLIAALAIGCAYILLTTNQVNSDSLEIKIRKGDNWSNVKSQLEQDNKIKHPLLIELTARILKYDQNIKPGRYVLKNGSSAFDIVRKLRSGNQDAVNFVINNITFPEQLASRVSQKLDIDSTEFIQFIYNPIQAQKYGLNRENFWSIFLCNTYQLYWDIGLEGFVDRMYNEYNKFWTAERRQKALERGLLPEEAIALASIVQKETNHKPEYGTVASVYLNRLRIGMPLQADPTVKFALKDMAIKRILKKDLETDSPYNTYRYKGLPPGPIGLPEADVIKSVISSNETNYLYFCAIFGSGKHAFSTNYNEHLNHARKYQSALNAQQIYR